MAKLARIVIALLLGPSLGALAGEDVAGLAGRLVQLPPGAVSRWEICGLLAGLAAGIVFVCVAIRRVTDHRGRADAVLLPLAGLAVAGALLGARAGREAALALRWMTDAYWLVGLLLLFGGRPPEPVVPPPPAEPAPGQEVAHAPAESAWDQAVSEVDPDV
jgi:hypothetical protein